MAGRAVDYAGEGEEPGLAGYAADAQTVLPDGPAWRIDRRATVDVLLDNEADALVSLNGDLAPQSGNLCQIGEEIVQFGRAEPIGLQRYRLSRLIRGWHGTEWASAGHVAGERFVLLDPSRLAPVAMGPADMGQLLAIRAVGRGDLTPAEATSAIEGRAMLPPAPVHPRARLMDNGDLSLGWTRRSRIGWGWADGSDAPLGEEAERYLLRIVAAGLVLREWDVPQPVATYAAADLASDLTAASPAAAMLEIRQIGTWGMSRPLIAPIP